VIASARPSQTVFAASLRNWSAEVERLVSSTWRRVALVGAETRGEFRREDQLCCAWIAAQLAERGFACADAETETVIERWCDEDVSTIAGGHSAGYLRRSGQLADLDYVLDHVDDLGVTFAVEDLEIAMSDVEVAESAA
jgi:2-phosphosulfolactate phosphatase